jgi:hypothetical protein
MIKRRVLKEEKKKRDGMKRITWKKTCHECDRVVNFTNTRYWDWITLCNLSSPINWDWIGDWSNPNTWYWCLFRSNPGIRLVTLLIRLTHSGKRQCDQIQLEFWHGCWALGNFWY